MKKRIWDIVVWAMVVLSVGIVGFWGATYWKKGLLRKYQYLENEGKYFSHLEVVEVERGLITVYRAWWEEDERLTEKEIESNVRGNGVPFIVRVKLAGSFWDNIKRLISFKRLLINNQAHTVGFVFPIWVFLAVLAPFDYVAVRRMVIWRRGVRRQRWLRAGRCGNCGYNMRASPQRCPECGKERERARERKMGGVWKIWARAGMRRPRGKFSCIASLVAMAVITGFWVFTPDPLTEETEVIFWVTLGVLIIWPAVWGLWWIRHQAIVQQWVIRRSWRRKKQGEFRI